MKNKKIAMTKVLSCLFVGMLLMSEVPVSVFASASQNLDTTSNRVKAQITLQDNPKSLKGRLRTLSFDDLILSRVDYNMSIAVENYMGLGRYTEATASGKRLLYGYPDAWSSYATIRIDGNDYYQGGIMDSYCTQVPTIINDSIIVKWTIPPNINVTEKLTLMPNTTEYRFTITNNDNITHNIGFRYLFDTMLGYNDGAPFRVPGVGDITTEQEFINPVFNYWMATDSLANPTLTSICTFTENKPYKVQFAYWPDIYSEPFDYTINEGRSITWDTAVGMYWNFTLHPGESKDIVVYYGIGKPIIGEAKPEIVNLFTDYESYLPNQTVKIFADVGNAGEAPLENGKLNISIRDPRNEVVFNYSEPITVLPDQIVSKSFEYHIPANAIGGTYIVTAQLYNDTAFLLDTKSTMFIVGSFNLSISPSIVTTSVGGEAEYKIHLKNPSDIPIGIILNLTGLNTSWCSFDRTVILNAGEEKEILLRISVPPSIDNIGEYNFSVSAGGVIAYATLVVVANPIIYELSPPDSVVLGTNDVIFSWRTSVNSTSVVYIKSEYDTNYTRIKSENGTIHVVVVKDLERNLNYSWYVESCSAFGCSVSEDRTFYVSNGIVFADREYTFNIERDYDQQCKISVINTDSERHELLVRVNNPYDDIFVGFVGEGSTDKIISLDPEETKDVMLVIHAQDAMLTNYTLTVNLTNLGEENITDFAIVHVNVRWPIINFSLNEIASDPVTLTKTLRITNYGDTITDLEVFASDWIKDRIVFQPAIDHFKLESGKSVEFNVTPVLEEGCEGINGTIFARGGNKTISLAVNFSCEPGKRIFIGRVSGGEYHHYRHVIPEVHLFPAQLSREIALIGIGAVFNRTLSTILVNDTARVGSKLIVNVSCLEAEEGEINITTSYARVYFENLSIGNYTIEVREGTLGEVLAVANLTIKPMGVLFEKNNLTGTIRIFKGNASNTSSIVEFPIAPPGLFKYTNFWMNSSDHIIMGLNLTNTDELPYTLNLSINTHEERINITPVNLTFTIGPRSSEMLLISIETNNLLYGIYNLSYSLEANGSTNFSVTGVIPIGIYEINSIWDNNVSIIEFISPFNDTVTRISKNLSEYLEGGLYFTNTTYYITLSNFTLSKYTFEVGNPLPAIVTVIGVAFLKEAAIDAALDLGIQTILEKKDRIDWRRTIKKSLFSGATGAVTACIPVAAAYHRLTKVAKMHPEGLSAVYRYRSIGRLWDAGQKWEAAARYAGWATKKLHRAIRVSRLLRKASHIPTAVEIYQKTSFEDHLGTDEVETQSYPGWEWDDTDGDGTPNVIEIEYRTDPLDPYSHPGLSLNYKIHHGSCINGAPLKSKFKTSPYLKEYCSPVRNVEAVYVLPYFPRTPPSSYRPFNTIIYLNGHEIGRIENTVPHGYYIFNADPSILNYASTGVGENVITLDVENMNRGYYVPLEGYKVYILFKEISIPVCAENQSEANRIASQLVGAMRRKPDFAVFSWDIEFSNVSIVAGEPVIINAEIYNLGTSGSCDVVVQFFDDDTKIGTKTIYLPRFEKREVNITWIPTTGDLHTITVKVNPDKLVEEMDYSNNVASKSVFVLSPVNQPPIASFTYSPLSPIMSQPVTFDASSSYDPDGNITKYEWDFGDGNITEVEEPVITHTYSIAGNYTVKLTVTDDKGMKSSISRNITVRPVINQPPIANANGPYTGIEGQHVEFNASASYDPEGANLTYYWEFGDGETAVTTQPTITHIYAQEGNYTVTLIVNDGVQNSTPSITYALINDTEPKASFTANVTSGFAPLTVQFNDLSQSYDGIIAWEWDFDGDGIVDSNEQNPIYTYDEAGTYTVSLTVYEADGDSDTETKTDYITVTSAVDTEPPTIESVTLDTYINIPNSSFHVTVEATDNVGVTAVTADGVTLTKTGSRWEGDIFIPEGTPEGEYTLTITAKDEAGNTAESSVNYSVVFPQGGFTVAIDPMMSSASAGDVKVYQIKIISNENFDDKIHVYISDEEIPDAYKANFSFNWTDRTIYLKSGETVELSLEVTISQASGYKMFRVYADSMRFRTSGYCTGIVLIS